MLDLSLFNMLWSMGYYIRVWAIQLFGFQLWANWLGPRLGYGLFGCRLFGCRLFGYGLLSYELFC